MEVCNRPAITGFSLQKLDLRAFQRYHIPLGPHPSFVVSTLENLPALYTLHLGFTGVTHRASHTYVDIPALPFRISPSPDLIAIFAEDASWV